MLAGCGEDCAEFLGEGTAAEEECHAVFWLAWVCGVYMLTLVLVPCSSSLIDSVVHDVDSTCKAV